MTEKNGSTESSTGQSKEIILGQKVIKRAETAQMRPTQNVVQSPFADHIPDLQPRPGQVRPDSTPASSAQPTAPNSGDAPSSDNSE